MGWRIGADIGGTFTDVVVVNDRDGRVGVAKVSTTPRDFARAVIEAIGAAVAENRVAHSAVTLLSHATTVVTNAILEEKGARVGLVATRGFRDVLELRRSVRGDLYDLLQDPPSVLVPRRYRVEVTERIDAAGAVVTPLDLGEVDAVIEMLRAWDVEAVAVSLLFSFLNDAHERAIGERIRAALPRVPVFLSSEVLPEIREFERTSTTAVCAYVAPILESYLDNLDRVLNARGLPSPYIMGSSGGVFEIAEALRAPAMIVESGPAAGVIAAAAAGNRIGRANLISFDMGGTTAKASLILNGRVETTPEYEVGGGASRSRALHGAGHPVRIPVIDLAEVSAGGGSIAWVDPAGALRVGPQSAGAEPGPVCYARGGEEPTVTDANLLLGRLDSGSLLDGDLPVDYDAAKRAVEACIGAPLGLDVEAAAAGIVDIVDNAMADALRTVSVERGHDPREFSLIAFGGAGPLHAVSLAEELDIEEVIVPRAPGAFSAVGLVGTDVKREYARTYYHPLDEVKPSELQAVYAQLEALALAMLDRAGIDPANRELVRSADLRYGSQAYELNVPAPAGTIDGTSIVQLADGFHAKHQTTYGHSNRDERVHVVTVRLSAVGHLGTLALSPAVGDGETRKGERGVWFRNHGRVPTPVHARDRLAAEMRIEGPAIVESLDSTVVLTPDWALEVGIGGFLFLRRT